MSCYHPKKAFILGTKSNGKMDLMFADYSVDHIEVRKDGSFVKAPDKFVSGFASDVINRFVEIPCGQCIGCKLDYSKSWANRCMLELNEHESSYFVTLTYDDEHLPMSDSVDSETGEVRSNPTLCKEDFQKFFKRLRRAYSYKGYDNKLRFYMAGEYGSSTFRPHYHCIIFGLKLDDLEPYKKSPEGYMYYNSPWLSKLWPYGFAVVGEVTWETCAYTARYVMKKVNSDLASFYEKYNLIPEYTCMSRRPGIAFEYYHKNNVWKYEHINLPTSSGCKSIKPPRYYEKLFEVEDPKGYALYQVKKKQYLAEEFKKAKLSQTSNNYIDMLQVEENVKKAQIKSLERRKI